MAVTTTLIIPGLAPITINRSEALTLEQAKVVASNESPGTSGMEVTSRTDGSGNVTYTFAHKTGTKGTVV